MSQNVEPFERELPLVVLGEMVIMPHMTVPLQVGQGKSYRAMEQAWAEDREVLLIFVSENEIEGYKSGQPQQLPRVGVIARLEEFIKLPDGTVRIILEGLTRAAIRGAVQIEPFYRVRCLPIVDPEPAGMEVEALMETVKQQVDEFVDHLGEVPQDAVAFVHRIDKPGHLADIVTYAPAFEFAERLEILNELDPIERLRKAYLLLARQLELLKLRQKIQQDTKEVLDQSQREYFLREQMRVIRRELGEDDEADDPIDELKRKIAELDAPEYVKEQALHELKRLAQQGMNSPEAGVIRTYLDWILSLPWAEEQMPEISLAEAQRVLDEDHYGLEKVKERLLEYLAVRKLAGNKMRSPILCLVGPPGVGKTSLGRSIARALGRKFVRTSLGGIRDEAEIRGHRRTNVGAQPGRIARAIKEAGTMNPVFLLDEVDKVGADWRGDPSSALLEVLDPAQNHRFRDHYLEVELDLSDVLFIATANVAETIPGPLLDRMEVVRLDGYTEEEKLAIARDHLLGRQLDQAGLGRDEVIVTEGALRRIISDYTREAGVRNLEREIGKLLRKVATQIAAGERSGGSRPLGKTVVDADDVPGYLGRQKFFFEAADRTAVPGVATGLAVTGVGGDVLFIEASAMDGEPGLTLTGQLGDVMKESATIALSYVRAHAAELGIDPEGVAKRRFHLHVPAGAVPKDGPSAGTAMTTALVSLLTGRPVRSDVGMTGEVTLQGRVLPIGGVKQKVLAAHRAGLKEVILPERNAGDLEDVPESVRQQLRFHLAAEIGDVLKEALA